MTKKECRALYKKQSRSLRREQRMIDFWTQLDDWFWINAKYGGDYPFDDRP